MKIVNILGYIIFTAICILIPGIGWAVWFALTLLIIAYNFIVTGYNHKKDKEELERYKKNNKDFWE